MIEITTADSTIRLLAASEDELEGEAVVQLTQTAGLAGMEIGVGFPDLHPGRGIPVGAAFLCREKIYPHIIGNDVGCGIGLWQTSLLVRKVKRDKLVKRLTTLPSAWDGDVRQWLGSNGLGATSFDAFHGTIGSGNHFAELQVVQEVYCRELVQRYALEDKHCFLLVHSGSRGLGDELLRSHVQTFGAASIAEHSPELRSYLDQHDLAVRWAASNRSLIAKRVADQLGIECMALFDNCHNRIQRVSLAGTSGWLHRKGAAAADTGPLVIAGSRGSLSYLVEPLGGQDRNLCSLAHGAGRKWNRKSCKSRLKDRFSAQALSRTELGSVVICRNKDLLYEEAPQAYKPIEKIIERLQMEKLIRVIASLRPIVTYKEAE